MIYLCSISTLNVSLNEFFVELTFANSQKTPNFKRAFAELMLANMNTYNLQLHTASI